MVAGLAIFYLCVAANEHGIHFGVRDIPSFLGNVRYSKMRAEVVSSLTRVEKGSGGQESTKWVLQNVLQFANTLVLRRIRHAKLESVIMLSSLYSYPEFS